MNSNDVRVLNQLKQRFGTVKLTSNGWARVACPTCSPKDRRKFKRYISLASLYNRCFICEVPLRHDELVGNSFVMEYSPYSVPEEPRKEHPMARVLPGKNLIPVNQLPEEHPAIRFLYKDYLFDLQRYYQDYGIVFCSGDSGVVFNSRPFITSAERLIFPVWFKKELVGWQMRSLPGTTYGDRTDVVKYYHLFNKGSVLFNYDLAKQFDTVILVEGVKKALKLPNAVACFGKDVTDRQVQLLSEWPNIIVCLDSQDVAQTIGRDIVLSLSGMGKRTININLAPYGFPSPDEMTSEQLFSIVTHEWRTRYPT